MQNFLKVFSAAALALGLHVAQAQSPRVSQQTPQWLRVVPKYAHCEAKIRAQALGLMLL